MAGETVNEELGLTEARTHQLMKTMHELIDKDSDSTKVMVGLSQIVETQAEFAYIFTKWGEYLAEQRQETPDFGAFMMGSSRPSMDDLLSGLGSRRPSFSDMLEEALSGRRKHPLEEILAAMSSRRKKERHPYADLADAFGEGLAIKVGKAGEVIVEGPDEELNAAVKAIFEKRVAEKDGAKA